VKPKTPRKQRVPWMRSRLRRLLCEKWPTDRQADRIMDLRNAIKRAGGEE